MVDDGSSDATAAIAREHGATVIAGASQPAQVVANVEAATWAMMMIGFAGLGFMAYRRRALNVRLV